MNILLLVLITSVLIYEAVTRPLATITVFGIYIITGLFALIIYGINTKLMRRYMIEDRHANGNNAYLDKIIENENLIRLMCCIFITFLWPVIFFKFKNDKSI